MNKFSNKTQTKLKNYVYVLTYKLDGKESIFYVGKGKNNRVFEHLQEAKKKDILNLSEKERKLITKDCNAYIVAAELSKDEALRIESVLISIFRFFDNDFNRLDNLVQGHHEFKITDVKNIEHRYADPINLEEFCQVNKIKVLVLKSNDEAYASGIRKDFRGSLEGIWSLDREKLESVDYVLGIYKGTIYGIYRYLPNSVREVSTFSQEEWERWNQIHLSMGRERTFAKEDQDLKGLKQTKKVFELVPLKVPESQNIEIITTILPKESNIVNKLINRTINDKKIKGQSGRYYFG